MAQEAVIHDVQPDFYGKRVAVASSDSVIRIHAVAPNGTHSVVQTLPGHTGPVWQVAWAHPKFGNRLASCGYDRNVYVWEEYAQNQWRIVASYNSHKGSVNAVAFAPVEYGLVLACGSSDENVSVLTFNADLATFETQAIHAHKVGVTSIGFAPYRTGAPLRFASGGCDNTVNVWRRNTSGQWEKEEQLTGHTDWVRDVAWCPNAVLPHDLAASSSQDGSVHFYKKTGDAWETVQEYKLDEAAVSLSWNFTGTRLAVTTATGKVTILKEDGNGEWVSDE